MIKLQVIGNIGKDATVNTVNGKNVINFTVAHGEKYKDAQGQMQEKTTWVDCALWTDKTNVAQYFAKGAKLFVEGKPEARAFRRSDGTPGSALSVRVDKFEIVKFAGDKEASNASPANEGYTEDLPF